MRLLYKTGAMESLRKWFYKPKRDDRSLLAQFFFADETLNMVAAELDSFDGREDPERCSTLVNQLRHAQERVLNITGQIMDQLLGSERVARGFRVKFPEDVLQDNLAGQLWFGAECLAAGSSIMNREEESAAMRPLAKALTRSLETVRALLREHCLRCNQYGASLVSCCSEMLHESLKIFDRLFAEFELCYVSAMVPVKSPGEFEVQQHICVLFSETLQRARRIGLLNQDQVDDYDPALMFAIPRLAIVSGLLIFSNGPLSIDKAPDQMSDMFRPFRTLLHKIRQLLWTLDRRELYLLEKLLCTNEDIANIRSSVDAANTDGSLAMKMESDCYPDISEFVTRFYSDNAHCKDMLKQMVSCEWGSNTEDQPDPQARDSALSARLINDSDYLPENMQVMSPILDGFNALQGSVTEEMSYEAAIAQSLRDVQPSHDTPQDHQDTEIESSVDDNTVTNNESKELHFHSRKEDIIRLNVQAPECEVTVNKELETIQENLNLTLTRAERRNSNLSHGSRKSSRNESTSSSHDFMIRNLSSNALSMFDPLAATSSSSVNINPIASENNILLPDQFLVSNLSDQVSEIADKLSQITYGDLPENSMDTGRNYSLIDTSISNLLQDQVAAQIYSYSSNDVSNLMHRSEGAEFQSSINNVNYSPTRSDKVISQLANMPSTSHGYLIPNAISHEPAILSTLSSNTSAIYDEDLFLNPINNPMMISQQSANLENDLFNDSISVANANLSSLLLTNEEFHNRFLAQTADTSNALSNCDEASFYSASNETITAERLDDYHAGENAARQRAKFLIGYDSDNNEPTPGDSGICTENTSLDRTPDSEIKDLHSEKNKATSSLTVNDREDRLAVQNISNEVDKDLSYGHFMDQNRILSSDNKQRLNTSDDKVLLDDPAQLRSSFSSSNKGSVTINTSDGSEPDVISSLHINYSEDSANVQKNDAGPSHNLMQSPEFVQNLMSEPTADLSDISISDRTEANRSPCDKILCSNPIAEKLSDEDSSVAATAVESLPDRTCNDLDSKIIDKVENCDNNISTCSLNECSGSAPVTNSEIPIETNAHERNIVQVEEVNSESISNSNVNVSPPNQIVESVERVEQELSQGVNATGVLNQRKLRKSTSSVKSKKKRPSRSSRETRIWSPGRFVLENRSRVEQRSPMRLNLDQLVDDGGDWQSSQSSATSSFHSECADDEEIALALQAQELASRHHTRAKFRSSEDLIHRLFVCIAGVADQLQTNFATDLRNILKSVFLMNQTIEIEPEKPVEPEPTPENPQSTSQKNTETIEYEVSESEVLTNGDSFDSIYSAEEVYADNSPTSRRSQHSLTALEGTSNSEENTQNDLNERRDSQPSSRQNSQRSLNSRSSANSVGATQQSEHAEIATDNNGSPRSLTRKDAPSRSSSSTSSDSNRNPTTENYYDTESIGSNSRVSQIVAEQTAVNGNVGARLNTRANLRPVGDAGEDGVRSGNRAGDRTGDRAHRSQSVSTGLERAPEWVPDIAAPDCMRCGSHFTAFRRRHHCRNCGKVFCASCSSNSIPLPRFGHLKPVRVCEECFQSTSLKNQQHHHTAQHHSRAGIHGSRRQTYSHR